MGKAEKENNTHKSDFSENQILDLNSLKPFELELKTKELLTAVAVIQPLAVVP